MQPEVGGTAQGAERRSALGSEDVGTAWELIILQISVQGSVCLGGAERHGQCFWKRSVLKKTREGVREGWEHRTTGVVPGVGARVGAGGRFCGWLVWCW